MERNEEVERMEEKWGLGFRVQDLEFMGLWVWGLGFGFRV
jgi:hypothetical protein